MLFLISSVAIHIGALVAYSGAPQAAHAHSLPSPVEIQFETVELPPEPKTQPLPLGKLEPLPSVTTPAPVAPAHAPPVAASASSVATTSEAPQVLASDNPYAQANQAVFTMGTASKATVRQVVAASPSTTFGVENGSASASEESKERLRAWYAKVSAQLSRLASRSYPQRAQKLGQQGTTKVQVRIDASGRLLAASVSTGSGHSILDHAALSGVQAVGQVTPPPAGVGPQSLTFPITFRLQ